MKAVAGVSPQELSVSTERKMTFEWNLWRMLLALLFVGTFGAHWGVAIGAVTPLAQEPKAQEWWYEEYPASKGGTPLVETNGPYVLRKIGMPTIIFKTISLSESGINEKVVFALVVQEPDAFRILTSTNCHGEGLEGITDCTVMGSILPKTRFQHRFNYFFWEPPAKIEESVEIDFYNTTAISSRAFDLEHGRVFVLSFDVANETPVVRQVAKDFLSDAEWQLFKKSSEETRVNIVEDWWTSQQLEKVP